jgi:tRNA nucleotidyltransferase (CCA-adding enzyme)
MTESRKPAGAGQKPLALPNREFLKRLGQIAQHIGTRSFLVGGPVRDLVLGRSGPDLDIAVEDRSREYGAAVAREFEGRFVYHSRFMTGTVSFPEQQAARRKSRDSGSGPSVLGLRPLSLSHIDITQTRAETYEMPAVLPAVRPASIIGDLGRRDFTVNSMAMELTPDSFGMFIDPFDGRADVKQRRVRILHARSFIDDPTRIFRCVRFAIRLGFAIEPHTLECLRAAVKQRQPAFLTPERVLYELRLICAEPLVVPMIRMLVREKVLKAAWRWTPPRGFLAAMAKLGRALHVESPEKADEETRPGFRAAELLFVYWLSVLPVTERFPVRKEERDAAEAVAGFGKLRPKLRRKLKPSADYKTLRSVPEPALWILAVLEPQSVSANIRAFLDSYRKVRIATTGADLRAAGLEPGPAYREILDKLLFARLDGRIRTVTEERALLMRLARQRGH